MSKKSKSSEKVSSQRESRSGLKWWVKGTSAAAAFLVAVGCSDLPNNLIRLNPQDQSVEFGIEHVHSEWSAWYTIIDYGITVSKQWDTYMGLIKEKNGWHSRKSSFEWDDLDDVFNQIAHSLDNEQITDKTRSKQEKKIDFVKKEFKDKVLNAENSSQIDQITIKYKSE